METMGPVFDALGSATRRRILDLVKKDPGCTVGSVAMEFDTTRIAVMHHIRMLEQVQLLISRKEGRKRRLYHNAVPIQLIYDRWTTEYSALWAGRMSDVKYRVENKEKGNDDDRTTEAGLTGSDKGADRGRVA